MGALAWGLGSRAAEAVAASAHSAAPPCCGGRSVRGCVARSERGRPPVCCLLTVDRGPLTVDSSAAVHAVCIVQPPSIHIVAHGQILRRRGKKKVAVQTA